jgi:CheY-like chemotaxis protein
VTKILVADDNSNVQKTVALALADLNVDVIAVNNGEAAVRKIPEIRPDLILADIFMPVRNGYEVCDFVKKEFHLQHVPVVLLVGAFDPLDEREAQRVGADGILKKPFVPPEPLITMVKTLLERSASQRLVEVPVSKAPGSKASVPVAVQVKSVAEASSRMPESREEIPPAEIPAPAPVSFGEGDRPVAFGSFLEASKPELQSVHTGVIEPVDNEQVLTNQRDASLGEPIFWRNDPPPPEAEGESATENPEALDSHSWGLEQPLLDNTQGAPPPDQAQPLELVLEGQDETSASLVDSAPLSIDPAANAALNVESSKAPELVANPFEWSETEVKPPPVVPPKETTVTSIPPAPTIVTTQKLAGVDPTPGAGKSKAAENQSPPVQVVPPSASTTGVQDQLKTMEKWADLSDLIQDAGTAKPRPAPFEPKPAPPAPPVVATTPVTTTPILSRPAPPVPRATLPTPVTATTPVTAIPVPSQPATSSSTKPAAADPALIEAVVQRVLDKMRPQVVDIITKEFLRPIVQALVTREIEKP